MHRRQLDDTAIISNFLRLKGEVLDRCNDPSRIEALAASDPAFRDLCLSLEAATWPLRFSAEEATGGIIAPVNQGFIAEWRDYEKRLQKPLAGVFLAGLNLDGLPKGTDKEVRDSAAEIDARNLFAIIDYIESLAASPQDREFARVLGDGLSAWRTLAKGAGLDLVGIFRRLQMVPTVFVPPHVATKFGDEQLSLNQKWIDARQAFVFGALQAATAMARSILELIFVKVYGVQKGNLGAQLEAFSRSNEVPKIRLLRIKYVADAVLHWDEIRSDKEFEAKVVRDALPQMEQEVSNALKVLRELIEDAPLRD